MPVCNVDARRGGGNLAGAADISVGIMQVKPMQSTSTLEPNGGGAQPPPRRGGRVSRLIWRLIFWFSPLRAWRELKLAQTARKNFAAGVAVGVFIACVPVYGFQTLLSLYAARRLSLHPLSVIAGSQLSAPPIGPVLSIFSIVVGRFVITGRVPHIPNWRNPQLPHMSFAVFNSIFTSWMLGGILLGFGLAIIAYFLARVALRLLFAREQASSLP
jgi:uncharacterized protein (DUF2062 family)